MANSTEKISVTEAFFSELLAATAIGQTAGKTVDPLSSLSGRVDVSAAQTLVLDVHSALHRVSDRQARSAGVGGAAAPGGGVVDIEALITLVATIRDSLDKQVVGLKAEAMQAHRARSVTGFAAIQLDSATLQATATATVGRVGQSAGAGKGTNVRVMGAESLDGAVRALIQQLERLESSQQLLLRMLWLPLVVGLLLDVTGPISEHFVKKWLEDSPQGQVKQANERVVSAAGGVQVLHLADYRLVVKHNLEVRAVPAAASRPVSALPFGAHVRQVDESGAFTLVEWRSEGDATVSGWVFTRYLKRFR